MPKQKIKEEITKRLHWFKDQCGDRRTILLYFVVWAVMYSPVLIGYPLYFLLGWKWCLIMASSYLLFWAGPFTPFIPVCIAITLFLKRKLFKKKNGNEDCLTE